MRIGMVTTSYPRHAGDNAGLFVKQLAEALALRGHTVEVCAPEPAIGSPVFTSESLVNTHWIPYLRPQRLQRTFYGAGVLDNLRADPWAWLGIVPFLRALDRTLFNHRHSWDALISHWALPCGLLAGRRRYGRAHIAVFHSGDVHLLRRVPWARKLAQSVLRGATHLVFVSEQLRCMVRALLSASDQSILDKKSLVLPMGFTPSSTSKPDRAKLRDTLGLSQYSVLMLARLVPVKGVDVALRAFQGAHGMELVIAGDGPLRNSLQTLARTLRTPVRWLGHVPAHEREAWLKASDALVLPSRVLPSGRSEGMPCVLAEAMHAGLPVVASSVGGIPELIKHGHTGWLVPPEDPEALRNTIEHIQRQPETTWQCILNAREAVQSLRWDQQALRYEALLQHTHSTFE